jgi:hypothetical protein
MADPTAAARQKRRRARLRANVAVYGAEVGEDVFDALEAGGLLDGEEADDRAAVSRALSKALAQWAQKYRQA